ncbi:MAG: diacylglycerol/lipid kinase family protein [Ilumatobacteraceae bacterium]
MNERATPKLTVVEHATKVSPEIRAGLRDALAAAGIDASWRKIPKARKATKAVEMSLEDGAEVVVVCGGDGTVRAATQALVDTGVPMAVVPAGTANLFATGLGLPTDPAEVIRLVTSGQRRALDTGECNDLVFNVMAGAGFDVAMVEDADAAKEQLGFLAYVRAGFTNARHRQPFETRVCIDGTPFFEGPATCVLVGNLGTLKGGIKAFPDASPTDGQLDIAVVTAQGLREWAALMVRTARRRQRTSPDVHLSRGTKIDVRLDEAHRFELDGGGKGTAKRLRFKVRPGSLVVCAPDDATERADYAS